MKAARARPGSIKTQKVKGGVGSGLVVSPSVGVDVSNGSFFIFEDQRESMDFEVGQVIEKVRNPRGAKIPNLGP